MDLIDLHTHSLYSDGTFNILELIKRAKDKNIKILSLTDHDTIEGLNEAKAQCIKNEIKFINGIEISTRYMEKDVHVLGYFIDDKDRKLLKFSEDMKQARIERNKKTIKILNEHGIKVTEEDTYRETEGSIISKTHIAKALITKGYVKDIKEAFDKYIGSGSIAYVAKADLTPSDGIKIIKESGGLAFLAHPGRIGLDVSSFISLLKNMKNDGLDGIEAYYSSFSKEEIQYFEKTAREYSLIKSAGSDFHGANREGADIGYNHAPTELFDVWDDLYRQKNKGR